MATYNSSASVNPNTTPYEQRLTRLLNKNFGDKPYQGSARQAPANIYGGQSQSSPFPNASAGMAGTGGSNTVYGQNLQADIPGHVAPVDVTGVGSAGAMASGLAGKLKRPFNQAYSPYVPLTRPQTPVTDTTAPQVAQVAKAPEQPPQQPPKNPGDTYQFTQAAADAAKIGDGGAHDQTVEMSKNRVNADIQRWQNSENPDAVRAEIVNDPWYANNSMWKGIFNAAAATYDGASVSEALRAGQAGLEQGEQEDTRNKLKENAVANRDQLLQQYTGDSVSAYMLTGDASVLREKKLTQAEQDARAAAATQAQYQREDQVYDRARKDKLADEQRKLDNEKGKWSAPNKQGYSINDLTGDTKYVGAGNGSGGAVGENGIPTNAQRITLNDGTTAFVNLNQKPVKSGSQNSFVGYDEKGNQFMVPQSSLPSASSASETQAQQSLVNDLNTLKTASGGTLSHITGMSGDIGELPIGSSLETKLSIWDKNARPVLAAAKRIQGAMQNQGIAQAKAMGASGINTEAEAKRYFQSMPQLDFSSEKALRASIETIMNKTEAWNKDHPNTQGALSNGGNGASSGSYDFNDNSKW